MFDREFQDGLARFQIRNGLRVSGFLDSRTYSALNVSAQERLKQLETNFARVKSLLKFNKAPRYVLVNVPAFTLQAIDRGNLALTSNVVVGKPTRATPAVSAQIVEVNFYPTWTVPESIAKADLIPKLQKNPGLLRQRAFQRVGGAGDRLGCVAGRPREIRLARLVLDVGDVLLQRLVGIRLGAGRVPPLRLERRRAAITASIVLPTMPMPWSKVTPRNARHLLQLVLVQRHRPGAAHRCARQRGVDHARQLHVDGVLPAPVVLLGMSMRCTSLPISRNEATGFSCSGLISGSFSGAFATWRSRRRRAACSTPCARRSPARSSVRPRARPSAPRRRSAPAAPARRRCAAACQ